MTLGASPQLADVVAELGESFPYTIPDARTRWLADVGAGSPVTLPTSFANKQSVKLVHVVDIGFGTGPISFTGVNFGAAFPGRVLVACYGIRGPNNATGNPRFDISNLEIGGLSAVGTAGGEHSATEGEVGNGIFAVHADSLGTSGNVFLQFSADYDGAALVMLSVSSISSTANDTTDVTPGGGGGVSINDNITSPANGVLIMNSVFHQDVIPSWTGCTLRVNRAMSGDGMLSVGWENRLGSQTRFIESNWGISDVRNLEAKTFAQ